MSDYPYQGMFNSVGVAAAAAASPGVAGEAALQRLTAASEVLLVTGVITESIPAARIDSLAAVPLGAVPAANLAELVNLQAQAQAAGVALAYTLEFADGQGNVLGTQPFAPTPPFEDSLGSVFAVAAPLPPGTVTIRLKAGTQVLSQRARSSLAPIVTVLSPNGGETIAGGFSVNWSASDADNDPLSFTVEYSPDSGAAWRILGMGIQGTSFIMQQPELLPGSQSARVRVIASDGFNTGMDTSDTAFTLGNRAPRVSIGSPLPGQSPRPAAPCFCTAMRKTRSRVCWKATRFSGRLMGRREAAAWSSWWKGWRLAATWLG